MDNFNDIYAIYSKIIEICDNFNKVLLRDIDIIIFSNYGIVTKNTIHFIKHLFFKKMKCLKIVSESNISYLTYDTKINIYNFNKQLSSYSNEPSYLSKLKYLSNFLFDKYYSNNLIKYNEIQLNKSENIFLNVLDNQVDIETRPVDVETRPVDVETQTIDVETQQVDVEKEIKMVIKPIKEIINDFMNNDYQMKNGYKNFCKYFLKTEVVEMLKHKKLPISVLNFEECKYLVKSLTNPMLNYVVKYDVNCNYSCECNSFKYKSGYFYSQNKCCKHINILKSIQDNILKIFNSFAQQNIPQYEVSTFINNIYNKIYKKTF